MQLERNGNLKGRVHIDLKRHGVIQCYDFVRDESGHPRAVVIGTGSRHGIYVYSFWEREEWKAGAFTKALTEGIEGLADFNHDTFVLSTEVDTYIYNRVTELTDSSQNPVSSKPINIRPFRISRVPK